MRVARSLFLTLLAVFALECGLATPAAAQYAQYGYPGQPIYGTVERVTPEHVRLATPQGNIRVPLLGTQFLLNGQPIAPQALQPGMPVEAIVTSYNNGYGNGYGYRNNYGYNNYGYGNNYGYSQPYGYNQTPTVYNNYYNTTPYPAPTPIYGYGYGNGYENHQHHHNGWPTPTPTPIVMQPMPTGNSRPFGHNFEQTHVINNTGGFHVPPPTSTSTTHQTFTHTSPSRSTSSSSREHHHHGGG